MSENQHFYIHLPEKSGYQSDNQQLKISQKLNIITGSNNAGKSRFVRDILLARPYLSSHALIKDVIIECKNNLTLIIGQWQTHRNWELTHQIASSSTLPDSYWGDLFKLVKTLEMGVPFSFRIVECNTAIGILEELLTSRISIDKWNALQSFTTKLAALFLASDEEKFGKSVKIVRGLNVTLAKQFTDDRKSQGALSNLREILKSNINVLDREHRIYVLPNRMLKTSVSKKGESLSEDIFTNNFHYSFEDASNASTVVSGQKLFDEIYRLNNGNRTSREKIRSIESLLSRLFFNHQNITLIASKNNGKQEILIELGAEEKEIDHVGDGIKGIIILLHTLVNAPDQSLIVIDEPEIHLHPGLQTAFLRAILEESEITQKEHTIFLLTHSNHFFDRAIAESKDLGIFHFTKQIGNEESTFNITKRRTGERALLEDLGIEPSSVFLTNCSIWCEGITDVIILRKLLELSFKEDDTAHYLEDIHYGFVLYGGSNLVQYEFDGESPEDNADKIIANAISSRILVVADADGKEKANKHAYFSEIASKNSDFEYRELAFREIENVLGQIVIMKFLRDECGFDQNETPKDPLENQDYVGKWIHDNLPIPNGRKFQSASGTLTTYYKKKLANFSKQNLVWEDLEDNAKDLANTLAAFISHSNMNVQTNK